MTDEPIPFLLLPVVVVVVCRRVLRLRLPVPPRPGRGRALRQLRPGAQLGLPPERNGPDVRRPFLRARRHVLVRAVMPGWYLPPPPRQSNHQRGGECGPLHSARATITSTASVLKAPTYEHLRDGRWCWSAARSGVPAVPRRCLRVVAGPGGRRVRRALPCRIRLPPRKHRPVRAALHGRRHLLPRR